MLSNETIAELVVSQLETDFGIAVEANPFDESRGRGGDVYFSLPVEQEFGIFETIIATAWIKISAGEVAKAGAPDAKQLSVMVALHYDHLTGGSNGSNICRYWFEGEKLVFASPG